MVSAGGVERYRVRAVRPVRANYLSFCLRKLVFWESGLRNVRPLPKTTPHVKNHSKIVETKNKPNTKEQHIERA